MLALRLIAASILLLLGGSVTAAAAAAEPAAAADQGGAAEASRPLASADNRPGQGGASTAAAPAGELEEEVNAEAEKARKSGCPLSHAINLGVTKALLRPPTNNPLDSFTYIAGIRCQQSGFLKQDTMLQSSIPALQQLAAKGLRFEFALDPSLTTSSFGPASFTSMYITSVDLYTGKTGFLWPNGQFHATGSGWINNAYSSPANNAFAAENPAPLNTYRLFELWYEHKLTPKFAVRLGKIYPWVKFASHQTSAIFQNMAFDFPGLYGTTTTTGNFLPYAAPPLGIQLAWNPNPHHQVLFHIMDGKDDPSGGYKISPSDLSLNDSDGVEILAEYAYLDHSTDPHHLPGYYKIGFQGNTGDFLNFRTGVIERGNYGGYVTLEKMLYAEPGTAIPRSQGLLGFLKFSGTAGDHTVVSLVGSAGLTYAGLIPGRDRDMAGIGVAVTQFNAAAASYYANQRGLVPSSTETVLEATYLAELTPWMMIFGSYQYVITPSSLGATDPSRPSGHVLLLGARLAL